LLFNRGASLTSISAPSALLGLSPGRTYTIRDLWAHTSTTLVAGQDAAIRTLVPSHGVAMYRISPADSPKISDPSAMGGPAAVEEKRGATRLRAPSALLTPMRA
jgi:alpha-galactosidase